MAAMAPAAAAAPEAAETGALLGATRQGVYRLLPREATFPEGLGKVEAGRGAVPRSGVCTQCLGVPLPGVDDVDWRWTGSPTVDDADERPVPADSTVGERFDAVSGDRPRLRR